jgi:hypothetical protein
MENDLMSAREVYNRKMIYWIGSYQTVLKYMKDYNKIFKPIVKGSGKDSQGTRYYVTASRVMKFVKMFENNQLA